MHPVNLVTRLHSLVARLQPCYQATALLPGYSLVTMATALLPGYPLAPLYRESSGKYTIRLVGLELVPRHYAAPRFRVMLHRLCVLQTDQNNGFSLRVLEILETLELFKLELLLLFAL